MCTSGLSPDLDNVVRPVGAGYDAGAYEYPYAIGFAPDNTGSGIPLDVIAYTHTLTNAGGVTDTFTLSTYSALGWPVTTSPPSPLTLSSGQTATVIVHVTIPAATLSGTVDTAVVTATSGADSYLTASVADTTTVTFGPQAAFAPDHTTTNATVNTAYTYTHHLTNTGNYTDTFDLAFDSSAGWGSLLDSGPFALAPGETATVRVRVDVPTDGDGQSDNSVVTATSTGGAAPVTVLDITSAFQPGVQFTPDHSQTVSPDITITYTHRLTNTGNSTDTFHLAFSSSAGWSSLLDPGPFTLLVGETTDVRVRVVVPPGAGGLDDTSRITATSTGGAGPAAVQDSTSTYVPGIAFAPDYTQDVPAGDTVTYTHRLTNTGTGPDTFDVGLASSSQGWATLLDSGPFDLSPGAATDVRVRVVVPPATGGLSEVTVITAASRSGSMSGVSAVVTDTSTSIRTYGSLFTPDHTRTVNPGETVTYTHHLTNSGNSTDTFALSFFSTRCWGTLLDSGPITLTAGGSTDVRVRVVVPPGSGGQEDVSTIVATSQLSPTFTSGVTDTTTALYTPGVVLTPSITFAAPAGALVTYTHYLTNTGNGPEQFDLSFSSSLGWSTLADPGPFSLNAGEGVIVRVQVDVPLGSGGLTDIAVLTATAQTGGVSARVTDTTGVDHIPGVALWPDYAESYPPDETHVYVHHLQNTGNGQDTFDVTMSSSRGWATLLDSGPFTLDAGETAEVRVSVHVPAGLISGTQTEITVITATSQADALVHDSAADTTTVGYAPGVSFAPDHLTTGATESSTYNYTHTLTNLGNYTDTFTITLSSSAGWGSLLSPGTVELAYNESTTVQVQVTVPPGGAGLFDTTVVTAASQGGAGPATVRDTTAAFNPGVAFTPDHSQTADPGDVITYTHRLTNTGDSTDTLELSLSSSRGWATLLDPGPFILPSGVYTDVRVRVDVPAGGGGLSDVTVVTATTLGGYGPADSVRDETTATYTPGVSLEPDRAQTVPAGSAVIYTHYLTNTGNGPDTFSVALGSTRGWGTLLDSGPFTLTAGAATVVRVQVTVPTDTYAFVQDITAITATATAGAVSDSVRDTTTAACTALAGVSVSAPPTATVEQDVTFTGSVVVGSPPITYTWNFDDGSGEQSGNPIVHTYVATGTFTALLTTTNPCSVLTATHEIVISAAAGPLPIYLPLVLRNY